MTGRTRNLHVPAGEGKLRGAVFEGRFGLEGVPILAGMTRVAADV
jgi:hypothetical protein